MNKKLKLFFKGFLIGAINMVPGISGGTAALLLGVYERLIASLNIFKLSFFMNLWQLNIKKIINNLDWHFLVPLGLGIIVAIASTAQLITFLLKSFPVVFYSLLLGLIIGSLIPLMKEIKFNIKNLIILIIGAFLAFSLVGLNILTLEHSLIITFISGFLAFLTMILPGISGSFVLILLNQYEYMIMNLLNFEIRELLVFIIGGILSLLLFAKLLNLLINKYYSLTIVFLAGLMLGSLKQPLELILINKINFSEIILPIIIGLSFVLLLEVKFKSL